MNYNLLHLLSKPSTIDELVVRVRKLPGILPLKSSGRKPIYNAIYRTLREARGMGLVECQTTTHRHIWSRTNTPIPVPQKAEQAELQFNNPKVTRPRTMHQELLIAREAINNILEMLK